MTIPAALQSLDYSEVLRGVRSLTATEKQELDRHITGDARFKSRYRDDIVAFVADCFDWEHGSGATDYQNEILSASTPTSRICVRAPHGVGKTGLGAWEVLHFALVYDGELDWKCIQTASVWRQLDKYLWPEIHKWASRIRWDRVDRNPFNRRAELLTLKLALNTGSAFPAASDNPAYIEGAHADAIFYLFDESKAIPPETWDAAEGAFSGDTEVATALAISTPGEPHGRFFDIQSRKPGYEDWQTFHITKEQAIASGRMSREWADNRLRQWGPDSQMYKNRVLGEFAQQDKDSIIPLAWVEAANDRWRELRSAGAFGGDTEWKTERIGVDVSDGGEDKSRVAERARNAIKRIRPIKPSADPVMAVTGVAAGIMKATGADAVVDAIGVGAGVAQRLREQTYRDTSKPLAVVAFKASKRTKVHGKDRTDQSGEMAFLNDRAAAWWNLRELLDPSSGEDLALPPDDLLTGDLCTPRYKGISGGRIQVESKDDLRKPERLGRSTDDGDSVVQAFWPDRPMTSSFNSDDFGTGGTLQYAGSTGGGHSNAGEM